MKINKSKLAALSLTATCLCGTAAMAQDSDQNGRQNLNQNRSHDVSRDQERASDARSNESRSQQSKNSRTATSKDSQSGHAMPEGWVTVATDYNDDGIYDAVETIYYYDFQQAQDRSRQRSGREDGRSASSTDRAARNTHIQGEITDLKTESDSGSSADQLIAEVKNSRGRTACVCLGPKSKLSKLNLKKGDRITAEGVAAQMKGKPVLLASKITANGQSVTQKLSDRQQINQLRGTLKSLREAKSKRGDGAYLVGEVETDDGTQRVHFGPKRQLSKLNLSEGDEVKVLTRKGGVSGRSATIALQVTADGQTVNIARQARQDNGRSRNTRDRSGS